MGKQANWARNRPPSVVPASVTSCRLPGVKLGKGTLRNPLEHLLGEDSQQLPADIQGLIYCPVVVRSWGGQNGHRGDGYHPNTENWNVNHTHWSCERKHAAVNESSSTRYIRSARSTSTFLLNLFWSISMEYCQATAVKKGETVSKS